MHILICPDKFKGTATAPEIAAAIAAVCAERGHTTELLPLADGGEGTLDVLGGPNRTTTVTGPLGAPVSAGWRLEDGTCVIGELDGKGKYTLQNGEGRESVDPFVAERQRESHLTMLGHKVLRFTFNELKDPGKLVEKMRLAGIPRQAELAEEWRCQWYGR